MKSCLILMSIVTLIAAAEGEPAQPGIHMVYERMADGSVATKCVLAPAGLPARPVTIGPSLTLEDAGKIEFLRTYSVLAPVLPQTPPRQLPTMPSPHAPLATVLWVDRNHRYGVAENIAITGDGMNIVSGWWLNAKRISCYRTMGTSTPLCEAAREYGTFG